MKVLVVLCHPEPKSFNAALAARAVETLRAAGHEVRVSDLYAMGFDPVSDRRNFTGAKDPTFFRQQAEEAHASATGGFSSDVAAEQEKLAWCDALVLQFPLWWFGLPAVLKGWVDRVFAMGTAYGGGRWYDRGVYSGKRAVCSLTTGGPETLYSPTGLNGDLETVLFPIQHGILRFTGFDVLPPFVAWGAARATDEGRAAYLDAWARRVETIFTDAPLSWPALSDYDETFRLKEPK